MFSRSIIWHLWQTTWIIRINNFKIFTNYRYAKNKKSRIFEVAKYREALFFATDKKIFMNVSHLSHRTWNREKRSIQLDRSRIHYPLFRPTAIHHDTQIEPLLKFPVLPGIPPVIGQPHRDDRMAPSKLHLNVIRRALYVYLINDGWRYKCRIITSLNFSQFVIKVTVVLRRYTHANVTFPRSVHANDYQIVARGQWKGCCIEHGSRDIRNSNPTSSGRQTAGPTTPFIHDLSARSSRLRAFKRSNSAGVLTLSGTPFARTSTSPSSSFANNAGRTFRVT